MAGLQHALRQLIAAGCVIRQDAVVLKAGVIGKREHARKLVLPQRIEHRRVIIQDIHRENNDAVDMTADKLPDDGRFPLYIAIGDAKQNGITALLAVIGDALDDLPIAWVLGVGADESDRHGAPCREPPCNGIRYIIHFLCTLQDTRFRFFADAWVVIERQRYRRFRDIQLLSDVLQCNIYHALMTLRFLF